MALDPITVRQLETSVANSTYALQASFGLQPYQGTQTIVSEFPLLSLKGNKPLEEQLGYFLPGKMDTLGNYNGNKITSTYSIKLFDDMKEREHTELADAVIAQYASQLPQTYGIEQAYRN